LELRKIKTLGPHKNFDLVKPGQLRSPIFIQAVSNLDVPEENPEEQLPNSSLAPFEPLILWTGQDARDSSVTHKIEVSA
jgi:hypothetical protein